MRTSQSCMPWCYHYLVSPTREESLVAGSLDKLAGSILTEASPRSATGASTGLLDPITHIASLSRLVLSSTWNLLWLPLWSVGLFGRAGCWMLYSLFRACARGAWCGAWFVNVQPISPDSHLISSSIFFSLFPPAYWNLSPLNVELMIGHKDIEIGQEHGAVVGISLR